MSLPRVYCPGGALPGGRVDLTGDHAHRLRQVLRLSSGDAVLLFDGRGHEWFGRVGTVSKHSVEVVGLEATEPVAESRVPVTLAVAVLKGDQMDAVVRDATMLGVMAIIPMKTAHVTVPVKAWQSGHARERWERVAVASATQCRRARIPDVRAVTDFEACLAENAGLRLICVEPDVAGTAADWMSSPAPSSVQLLIGPEGAWSRDEVRRAADAGAQVMSLGPRTLRAETAPIVALSLVSAVWGW